MIISQTLVNPQPKKHSVRYDAQKDEVSLISTSIYISKAALPVGRVPKQITLTLEYTDA